MFTSQLSITRLYKPVHACFSFLASLEIWPVAFLAAASFLSARLLIWTIVVAAIFWPVRWAATARLSVRTPADWGVLLLLLMVPVTLWATALPEITIPQVYRLLAGIGLYYSIVNWTSTVKRLEVVLTGVIVAGLALSAVATIGVEWSANKLPFIPDVLYKQFPLLLSDTINPNVLGGSLVILLPLVLSVLLFSERNHRWWQSISLLLVSFTMTAVLILTKSRGAWMALGAALVLLALMRWRYGWIFLLLCLFSVPIFIYYLGLGNILETLVASNTLGGIEGRVEVWSRAIYMIQDFPFTGVGLGSFGPVADLLYPFFLAAPGKIPHAHNLFLQVAVDLGFPGLLGWLSIWALITFTAIKVYFLGRRSCNALAAALGAGLVCSQVALVVHGLFDAVVWGMVRPAPIVWVMWGMAITAGSLFLPRNASNDGE